MDVLEEFSYLWDGSDPGWVLIYLNPDEPREEAQFAIEQRETKMGLIIEDDELYAEVIKRMAEAGVEVIESRPDASTVQIKERLGRWIQQQRHARGWQLRDLAKRIDVHPKHVIALEQGKGFITWWLLTSLAGTFEVPIEQLITQAGLNTQAATNELDWLLGFDSLPATIQDEVMRLLKLRTAGPGE